MCGIAGRFSPEKSLTDVDRAEVQRMTDRLRHRGPDGDGLLDGSPLAVLGHRRLSIIDVARGQQPMTTADGRIGVTFNGEIYNYRTLRDRLAGKGHSFRTDSDTEVLLASYVEWGEECVEQLDGMFAFAILDLPRERLFLARDPFGKKPLYCRWRSGVLDFASEVSALRLAADWQETHDPVGLSFYMRLGYIPSPWTAHRGVEKLRPGECLRIDRGGIVRRRYWEPRARPDPHADFEKSVETLDGLLEEAVRVRLMSEVPLGAFLSGGIDSGLVVAMMAKLCGPGVKTTSVGFADEAGGGEVDDARAVARLHHTDHQEIALRADAASLLGQVTEHFGEPFADASAIPTWLISQETRRRVTVALTGDGGDEPFGGYDFRYAPHLRDARLRAALPPAARRMLFGPLASVWPVSRALPRALRLRSLLRNLSVEADEAFFLDLCFTPPPLAAVLAPDLARHGAEVEEHVRGVYRAGGSADPLDAIMLADIKLYMTENVLVKVDRMSMAHALEVRCPLLSKSVVEFALVLPSALKLRGGVSKAVLRALCALYLPARSVSLPKRGFHTPLDQWFRNGLESAFERDVFDGGPIPWLDRRAVRRVWDDHRSGAANHGHTLWMIWALGAWSSVVSRSCGHGTT